MSKYFFPRDNLGQKYLAKIKKNSSIFRNDHKTLISAFV